MKWVQADARGSGSSLSGMEITGPPPVFITTRHGYYLGKGTSHNKKEQQVHHGQSDFPSLKNPISSFLKNEWASPTGVMAKDT